MLKFFKKNNFIFGLALGILSPVPVYGVFWGIDLLLKTTGVWNGLAQPQNLFLLSLIGNLILMRIYFINMKYDKTAKGILLISFILGLTFFLIFYHRA